MTRRLPALASRVSKFSAVGLSGVAVNMGTLWLLTEYAGVLYLLSSVVAIELSILNNFWWNHTWTWSDREDPGRARLGLRVAKYHASTLASAGANWVILALLTESFGLHYLLANAVGIAFGVILNFTLSDRMVFTDANRRA